MAAGSINLFALAQKLLIGRAILQKYAVKGTEIGRVILLVALVSAGAARLIGYMHCQNMGAAVGG
jgi:hypothetical protein